MSEAFDGVDEFCWACLDDPGTSPDAAQDSIHMMAADDWSALRVAWAERPSKWREGCAYLLGLGPPVECLPLLAAALTDSDVEVAAEAARGYAALVIEHGMLSDVTQEVRGRLQGVLAATGGADLAEVVDLLRALTHLRGDQGW